MQEEYASAAWQILESFGYRGIIQALTGEKIYYLTNILTLDHQLRGWFDKLELWFEPTVRICFHVYLLWSLTC